MKNIIELLEEACKECCDKICKYPNMYSKEEWDKMMEEDKLPCNDCPLMKIC